MAVVYVQLCVQLHGLNVSSRTELDSLVARVAGAIRAVHLADQTGERVVVEIEQIAGLLTEGA